MVTVEKQIKILQAYNEGKTIQVWDYYSSNWVEVPEKGSKDFVDQDLKEYQFNFSYKIYRIKPGQEVETQQDQVKTGEIDHELIKEQIANILEPMLKPEVIQREIKAYIEDRFYGVCVESIYDAAFTVMMRGLRGTLDSDTVKNFKKEFQNGIKAYLNEVSTNQIQDIIKNNISEILKGTDNNKIWDLIQDSIKGDEAIRDQIIGWVEKVLNEDGTTISKIREWAEDTIKEHEADTGEFRDLVNRIINNRIENDLSIRIELL